MGLRWEVPSAGKTILVRHAETLRNVWEKKSTIDAALLLPLFLFVLQ